jgi:hypothetical protein
MQFVKGKPPESQYATRPGARAKRREVALGSPGFEPGRIRAWLHLRPSQGQGPLIRQPTNLSHFTRLSVASDCRGSSILSAACPLVPGLFVLLCARFFPAMSFWSGLLLLMQRCLLAALVKARLLPAWSAPSRVAALIACCRALPPLLPPLWGEAWSPICSFVFIPSTCPQIRLGNPCSPVAIPVEMLHLACL